MTDAEGNAVHADAPESAIQSEGEVTESYTPADANMTNSEGQSVTAEHAHPTVGGHHETSVDSVLSDWNNAEMQSYNDGMTNSCSASDFNSHYSSNPDSVSASDFRGESNSSLQSIDTNHSDMSSEGKGESFSSPDSGSSNHANMSGDTISSSGVR